MSFEAAVRNLDPKMCPDAMPLVSIIMNCFNGETYLEEALASIRSQTYQNWELIFWDNQSTDRSACVFKSFDDIRFKYYYADVHTDLGKARKLAMEQARGQWVAFLDVDDLWLPDKLIKQINVINRDADAKIGLIYGRSLFFDMEKKIEGELHPSVYFNRELPEGDIHKKLLLEGNFIPFLSALILKSAYYEVGGFPDDFLFSPDYYLFVLMAKKYRVKAIQDYIVKYRVHKNNLTNKMWDAQFRELLAILALHIDDYPEILPKIKKVRKVYRIKSILRGQFPTIYKMWRYGHDIWRYQKHCIFIEGKYFDVKIGTSNQSPPKVM